MAQAIARDKSGSTRSRGSAGRQAPVLRVTRYDVASAALIALLIGMLVLTCWITALWLANRRIQTDEEIPVEMLVVGGYEDGAPDETLKVESPEDPTDDPAVEETPDETQIEEVVENVVELSNRAARQVPTQNDTASENSGKVGSKDGTGRRPLGAGGGEGNFAQRWFVRFNDAGTLDDYARQLDYFETRLGVLPVGRKRMLILGNLSNTPANKTYKTGKDLKKQFYFRWAAGKLQGADARLLKRNGVSLANSILFHLPSQKTVSLLYKLEGDKLAQGKKRSDIQRVYFTVRRKGSGYEFVPTKYIYK